MEDESHCSALFFADVEELKVWLCYVAPLPLQRQRRWRMRPIAQHYSFVDVEELKVWLCTAAPSLSFGEG